MRMAADLDDTLPTDDQSTLAALREAVLARSHHVVDWAARTDAGAVRQRNEDAWAQADGRTFAVADGMGGHEGGALASRLAVRGFVEAGRRAEGRWVDVVAQVNRDVRAATRAAGHDRAGTTLVALVVGAHRATVLSVGDSRVMRCRGGVVETLTRDHTVRAAMLAAGVDADAERARGVRTGGLTAFVGTTPERLQVEVVDVDLAPGDRFLLCSDGVHRYVADRDLRSAVAGPGTCDLAATRLVDLAARAGGRDNATALLVDVDTRDAPQEPR